MAMEKKFQVVFSEQEEASSAFNQLGEYTSIAKYAQYDLSLIHI